MDSPKANGPDALISVKERTRLGPLPGWAKLCPLDVDCKARPGVPVTDILISRQIHAENRQTFVYTARRLESMEAVQHESQWRLQIDPLSQSVTLHWIKIRRAGLEFDHTNLNAIRLLEREQGLEGFVLDGWITLLILLEDVRPGDVLESCYTIESHPRLLPDRCTSFITLPQGIPVGRFWFSILFSGSRAMKWISSAAELSPQEHRDSGMVLWNWSGEGFLAAEPEICTANGYMGYSWIQCSDCPDWRTIAGAVAAAWNEEEDNPAVAEICREIEAAESDSLRRVERAIQLVQDEYRYLSVNLDLGGYVPASPDATIRRRFGDCKDLSFLLVHILKKLGFAARSILVSTALRKDIDRFLPMVGLFNHAVVELTVQGRTLWLDATLRRQGGGPFGRFVPDYGVGLPVDSSSAGLVEAPAGSRSANMFEVTESLLLDTTGAPSLLASTLRVTGIHADDYRQQIETGGVDRLAQERLKTFTSRYGNAKRVGSLKHHDNRSANEFLLAEVFEVNGFLAAHAQPELCVFRLPVSLVMEVLRLPERQSRRTPFALPHPCNIVHTFEIETASLQPMAAPRRSLESSYLQFNRRQKSLHKYWSMTLNLTTLTDAVPATQYSDHEKLVEQIWRESAWEISVPIGVSRPRQRSGFGELPILEQTRCAMEHASNVRVQQPGSVSSSPDKAVRPLVMASPIASVASTTSRHRRSRKSQLHLGRFFMWAAILISLICLFAFLVLWMTKPPELR